MTKLQIALLVAVSIAVGVFAPYQVDFRAFYQSGHDVLSGVNPYVSIGFYNPIHVAVAFAPIALIPFGVAWHIWAGLSFAIYVIALSRLMKRRVLWLALLAPFGLLIAWYGNLDALVLLGVTLPTPIGVWLLLAKPQIGLFAAALMLWQYRSWRLALAVGVMLVASLALGMIHGGLATNVSISPWPWGLLCASDRVDPCFECNADRTICHGRSYDSPDANRVYYRFDINGQWKPYLPIKLNKIPPNEIHKDMLYIPSLNARIFESMDRELRDYEMRIVELMNDYRVAVQDTIHQHEKNVDDFARQLGMRDD